MKLHLKQVEFKQLISIVAEYKQLPEAAIERDYYIVLLLKKLENSQYIENCIFKGGTSLSKCYPNTIERFSEDIDLTFVPDSILTDKQYDKELKKIEQIISFDTNNKKITSERNSRNKSMYIWFDDESKRIKLEIGSIIRPEPYTKRVVKSYIHEYLESNNYKDEIIEYDLEEVKINVLNAERTFLDKLFAVKRHALCGTLRNKVRHIYDVVKLFNLPEVKLLLKSELELKELIKLTKDTDNFYLKKRNGMENYHPNEKYDFTSWMDKFNTEIQCIYESLHKTLLYTNETQKFSVAIEVFIEINDIFNKINE